MSKHTYIETFDDGPNGWIGWDERGAARLPIRDGVAESHSPWWVDYNHAPPGAGYLHILFCLHTSHPANFPRALTEISGRNRFVQGRFPTDFTNANITVRLKGDVKLRGARLVLLVQGDLPTTRVNQVLMAQPIKITPNWSEQTIQCVPDQRQWVNMGTRHDRRNFYGHGPINELLRDVNCDIIFVLFPLDVAPRHPQPDDPHILRAGADYDVDRSRLPEGHVELDEVQIEFAM